MKTAEQRRAAMLAKYGPKRVEHADQITLYSEPIRDTTTSLYWARCAEHGLICEKTKRIEERTMLVDRHLRGLA